MGGNAYLDQVPDGALGGELGFFRAALALALVGGCGVGPAHIHYPPGQVR